MQLGVIDYGVGNLGSVRAAVRSLGYTVALVENPTELHKYDRIVLPGVGGFSDCITLLNEKGWSEAILDFTGRLERPMLGICLGMQLLASFGEEGAAPNERVPGLGLIAGQVRSLRSLGCQHPVPHVGWNTVRTRQEEPLFDGFKAPADFYFVHSYAFDAKEAASVTAWVDYGVEVAACVRHEHVWGTQFHPEKSAKAGLKVLDNFMKDSPC